MINENMNLLANTIKGNLNQPLNEFVACAQVNGQSISYSRCVYCHAKTIDGRASQQCGYM